MTLLSYAVARHGILLPEPDARRLVEAIDTPLGWSGQDGRYTHANGLVIKASLDEYSSTFLTLLLPENLVHLCATQGFPQYLPDHAGVADSTPVLHPHPGREIGQIRAPSPSQLPDGQAFGQALSAACGPQSRALVGFLQRACAQHFGGGGQWAATEDPEDDTIEERITLTHASPAPTKNVLLHRDARLLPLIERLDLRAFQKHGLSPVYRLVWDLPPPLSAHQRAEDRHLLAHVQEMPECPDWLSKRSD